MKLDIVHHGAAGGVTGSCHELRTGDGDALLIDCGLFQGAETSGKGANANSLAIEFPLDAVRALVVTHVHIDHVGRIPYLLAAGFSGPIYCSQPSARLLPVVLEDALKIGVTRNQALIRRVMAALKRMIKPLPYGQWASIETQGDVALAIRLQRAGHILGSAWVDCRVGEAQQARHVIFSGDLGNVDTPLLRPPDQPESCDVLVMESTYGDRDHIGREARQQTLEGVLRHALHDRGAVLIPAFSIGRTQELLYELEDILHRNAGGKAAGNLPWADVDVILDSPMAAKFTELYKELRPFWDAEAKQRLSTGRHPLDFDQLTTIDSHQDHMALVAYLARTERPVVVLAASGMCAGGRIVNYLKAMLGSPRNDILFVGYQAQGTPGRDIQTFGPDGGYVRFDDERIDIRAQVHTVSGYSAHADQAGLLAFACGMQKPPAQLRLIHGDPEASAALAGLLRERLPSTDVVVASLASRLGDP